MLYVLAQIIVFFPTPNPIRKLTLIPRLCACSKHCRFCKLDNCDAGAGSVDTAFLKDINDTSRASSPSIVAEGGREQAYYMNLPVGFFGLAWMCN